MLALAFYAEQFPIKYGVSPIGSWVISSEVSCMGLPLWRVTCLMQTMALFIVECPM